MKHSPFLLRIIQILTLLVVLAIIALVAWNFQGENNTKIPRQLTKVRRPANVGNATYDQAIHQGDSAILYGNLETAIRAYQAAATEEPRQSLPYEKIGRVYMLQRNYEAAFENFRLAQSLNPQKQSLIIEQVKSLIGLRKMLEAAELLKNIQPATESSLYYQGILAAALNEPDAAKDLLKRSQAAGIDETLKTNAQKVLYAYRDFELAKDSKSEYLQTLLAAIFDQTGEYGLAIELAFDAVKTKPDYRDAWIILGHAFLNEEKWLEALDALNKAIDLDSAPAASYFFRGIAKRGLAAKEKITEAIADFEKALSLGWQPKILAAQQLADVYFDINEYEKAFPLYKEIVLLDPSEIERFVRPMALAINHLNKPEEAILLAKKAYESHPTTAMSENLLGWAAIANGDFGGAKRHLEEALRRDPELPAVYLNLGQLYEKESKFEEAKQYYEKAIKSAEAIGNSSIGNTAKARYNELESWNEKSLPQEKIAEERPPSPSSGIPSLSLE